jgi:hypothetical protein
MLSGFVSKSFLLMFFLVFIIRSKIKSDTKPIKGPQYGDISQKVGT